MNKSKNSIIPVLCQLGLSDKEALVYLEAVALSEATAGEISKGLTIKRSTVYFIIQRLVEKDLLVSKEFNGKEYFRAVSPFAFVQRTKAHASFLEAALPQLFAHEALSSQLKNCTVKYGLQSLIESWQEWQTAKEDIYYIADSSLGSGIRLSDERSQGSLHSLAYSPQVSLYEYRIKNKIWLHGLIPYREPKKCEQEVLKAQQVHVELRKKGKSELRNLVFFDAEKFNIPYELACINQKLLIVSYQHLMVITIDSAAFTDIVRNLINLAITTASSQQPV